jgi:hypothetical protein
VAEIFDASGRRGPWDTVGAFHLQQEAIVSNGRRFDISMHHIPVRGGLFAAPLIGVLLVSMAIRLPALRWPMAATLIVGPLIALFLIWRRRTGLPAHPPAGPGTLAPEVVAPESKSFGAEDPTETSERGPLRCDHHASTCDAHSS